MQKVAKHSSATDRVFKEWKRKLCWALLWNKAVIAADKSGSHLLIPSEAPWV